MNGFIMAPSHNKPDRHDATGAFHIGAAKFQKVHSLPPWVRFENTEDSKTADAKGFLKMIQDQAGGWDVFAYFGHGDFNALGSADVRGRKGATNLANVLRQNATPAPLSCCTPAIPALLTVSPSG